MKRPVVIAIAVGLVVQFVGLFVIHGWWLKEEYLAGIWRTPQAMSDRGWAMLLSIVAYVVGAVLIYAKGVEAKPWAGQGIRFGILMACVTVVYGSLSGWVLLPLSHVLIAKWVVAESALAIVFGLIVAAICQPLAVSRKP